MFYDNSADDNLNFPTQGTRDLMAEAMQSMDRIWLEGRRYMKASIMLDDFTHNGVSQRNLFDENSPRPNSTKLMKVLNDINKSGLGNPRFAVQRINA